MDRLTDLYDEFEFLAFDLEIDQAVTAWQVRRWYQLSQAQLEQRGFVLDRRLIKPTKGSEIRRSVVFVLLDEELRRYSETALLHLAGTAEMRWALGVGYVLPNGPQEWSSSAWREAATMVPDALWEKPDGSRIAIEFDSTHYDNERVAQKAERFSEFDGQVWGAPTRTRVEALKERVLAVDPRARVVLANPLTGR